MRKETAAYPLSHNHKSELRQGTVGGWPDANRAGQARTCTRLLVDLAPGAALQVHDITMRKGTCK